MVKVKLNVESKPESNPTWFWEIWGPQTGTLQSIMKDGQPET